MKFSYIGRILAALNVIAMPGISIWQFNTKTAPLCLYTGLIAILVGLIEVPLLCSCMKVCVIVAKYTKRISGFWWIRAVLLTLIAAGGIAIYQTRSIEVEQDGDSNKGYIYMLLCHVSLLVSSFFYLAATYKGEENPAGGAEKGKGGNAAAGGGIGGFFGRAAVKAAKENPEAAVAVAGAVAPSIGTQLFGGFGSSASSSATAKGTPKGFYDDDEESSSSGGYSAPQVPIGNSSATTSSSSPSSGSSKGFFGGFGGFGGGNSSSSSSSNNNYNSKTSSSPGTSSQPSAPGQTVSDFQPAPSSSGKGFYDDDVPESNPFLS